MCGLPGSGKSTKAKEIRDKLIAEGKDVLYLSSDELRMELTGSYTPDENDDDIIRYMRKQAKEKLYYHRDSIVIYDSCNISDKRRRAFMEEFGAIPDIRTKCVLMATPYEECLQRNDERERHAPEAAIRSMYYAWASPSAYEGWDEIETIYPENFKALDPDEYVQEESFFDLSQDNPHHAESLGVHSENTAKAMFEASKAAECIPLRQKCGSAQDFSRFCYLLGLLHDIGKPDTKSFHDAKGCPSETAHFYGHEHISAYKALFFDCGKNIDPRKLSVVIGLHMKPHQWAGLLPNIQERTRNKYKRIWGEDLFHMVDMLYKSDLEATLDLTKEQPQKEEEPER
jgi:predicted kinase